jgi:hypothetical protein
MPCGPETLQRKVFCYVFAKDLKGIRKTLKGNCWIWGPRDAEEPNMGNHGTTMFDDLRGCWITIHWPHSHQFRTPLGSTRGFRDWNIFFPLHSGFLRLDMWTVWGTKTKQSFFLRRTNPWTNRGQTVERHQKVMERHKKVVERHKKVVDAGIKYPKLEVVVCSALIPKILE